MKLIQVIIYLTKKISIQSNNKNRSIKEEKVFKKTINNENEIGNTLKNNISNSVTKEKKITKK